MAIQAAMHVHVQIIPGKTVHPCACETTNTYCAEDKAIIMQSQLICIVSHASYNNNDNPRPLTSSISESVRNKKPCIIILTFNLRSCDI